MIAVPVEAQGLFAVPASGGQPRRLTRVADSDTDHFSPDFLPGGERLLFCEFGEHHGVFSISVDATENTVPRQVTDGNCAGVAYANPGYLLVLRDASLTAQAFDPGRLQTVAILFRWLIGRLRRVGFGNRRLRLRPGAW